MIGRRAGGRRCASTLGTPAPAGRSAGRGTVGGMSGDERERDEHEAAQEAERVGERAHLLPEELAAGSDDPERQAAAILAESDERTAEPELTRAGSTQTPGGEDEAPRPDGE